MGISNLDKTSIWCRFAIGKTIRITKALYYLQQIMAPISVLHGEINGWCYSIILVGSGMRKELDRKHHHLHPNGWRVCRSSHCRSLLRRIWAEKSPLHGLTSEHRLKCRDCLLCVLGDVCCNEVCWTFRWNFEEVSDLYVCFVLAGSTQCSR